MKRQVNIAPEVRAVLGAGGVMLATDPRQLDRVRCPICSDWAADDEPMELIIMRAGRMGRISYTHTRCLTSQVIRLPADTMHDLRRPGTADCRCALRLVSPRAIVIIDLPGTLFTLSGSLDTSDLLVRSFIRDGFDLLTDLEQPLPRVDDWSATFTQTTLTVMGHRTEPHYEGSYATSRDWLNEARKSGEVVLMTGSQLGMREAAPMETIDERLLDRQAVAARIPVSVDQAIATQRDLRRNTRCPCGSGLKYRHCHGQ
jgi:hypothetical protein